MKHQSSNVEGAGSGNGPLTGSRKIAGAVVGLLLLSGATFAVPAIAQSVGAASGSTEVCPSIGDDAGAATGATQGCGAIITISSSGTVSAAVTSQGPYDGTDDTLVGVINNSSSVVPSIAVSAAISGQDIFGFDGDGICTYYSAADSSNAYWEANTQDTAVSIAALSGAYCASDHDPTANNDAGADYEGPMNTWSDIASNQESGTVVFTGGLQPGESTFFSLEEAPTAAGGSGSTTTPGGSSQPYQVAFGTTISLGESPSSVALGGTFTLTATVTGAAAQPPTGTVSWAVTDPNSNAAVCATSTLVRNAATCTVSNALAGTYSATASYSGDANNGASTSAPLTLTVSTPPATITSTPIIPVVPAKVCVNKTHVVRVKVVAMRHGQRIVLIKREIRILYNIETIRKIETRGGKKIVVIIHKRVPERICRMS